MNRFSLGAYDRKRIRTIVQTGLVAVLFAAGPAGADTIMLKDGRVVQGLFKGGNDATVVVEAGGVVQTYAITDIMSVTFNSPRAASAPAPAAPTPAPGAQTAAGTLPVGTRLMVKLDHDVSTASHKKGSRVTGVLDTDLASGGSVIVSKGTKVFGTVTESIGGRRVGKAAIMMTFTDLSINDQLVPIATGHIGAESEGGKVVRKAAAGALIGGAVDGGSGAGKGAMIGAGVGLLGPGNNLKVPAGTVADVTLTQPLTLTK